MQVLGRSEKKILRASNVNDDGGGVTKKSTCVLCSDEKPVACWMDKKDKSTKIGGYENVSVFFLVAGQKQGISSSR